MDHAFTVRPADDEEIEAVGVLFRAYARSLGQDLSYQGFEAELAGLPGAYAPPSGVILVAVPPLGQPLGCVAVRAMGDTGNCEMKRLYARPAARGAGVGRVLAAAAIEWATATGYRAICLDTLPDMHAAQTLYRSLGFEVTPAYYDTPVVGTIFMRRTLH